MISLTQVTKTYQRGPDIVHALRNLDLDFQRGECAFIMGPSGSGKSTLLHLLGCLDTPTTGSIFFDGTELARLTSNERAEIRRTRVGFVFQRFNQIPNLSAQENVELPLLLAGVSRRQAARTALGALERVALGQRASHRPSELSGGELQRVTIARALINDPDVVLADEPTGSLDVETGSTVISLIRRLATETEACVVVVTHDHDLSTPEDVLVHMRDGRRVDGGTHHRERN